MSYDASNRVTGYTDSQGTDKLLGYDSRGNVTTLGSQAFIYDAANQPRAKTNGTYIYDGNMKRVKSYDGNTGETIYNVFSKASGKPVHIEVYSANGFIRAKTYRYVAGKRITRFYHVDNPNGSTGYNTIYFHEDHLGSPLVSSNPNGDIRWRERYSPFGEGLIDPTDNYDQPGFTGHIKDRNTGLNYMQARYYDPVMGRFLSHDPVQFSAGQPLQFNRYTYTWNNPINALDPDGEFLESLVGYVKNMFNSEGTISHSNEEHTEEEIFEAVDFDEDGPGRIRFGIRHPIDSNDAIGLLEESEQAAIDYARESVEGQKQPAIKTQESLINGDGNAYRHLHGIMSIVDNHGADFAKRAGDAYERGNTTNSPEQRATDLINNHNAIRLRLNNPNANLDTLSRWAIIFNHAQRTPVRLKND